MTRTSIYPLPPNVTYRQFDHWVTRGWIYASGGGGHGHPRDLSNSERAVLEQMGRLVADGVTPARAVTLARELVANGTARLAGHVLTPSAS